MILSRKGTVLKLVHSMVIKSHTIAVAMNKNMYQIDKRYIGTYNSDDLTTWAYYRNLAGLPHYFNTKNIFVQSIDTGERIDIAIPGIFDLHPITLEELRRYEDYYKETIVAYPADTSYIRGIINPIDMDTAITAEDGTILRYDARYIDKNEVSLIHELERRLKRWITRWDNPSYVVTDDLYASSLYGMVVQFLIMQIPLLKNRMYGTFEADTLSRRNFFNSSLGLGNYLTNIPFSSELWLYKHLDYLIDNSGTEETMRLLFDKYVIPAGVNPKIVKLLPKVRQRYDAPDKYGYVMNTTSPSLYAEDYRTGRVKALNVKDILATMNEDASSINPLTEIELNLYEKETNTIKDIEETTKAIILEKTLSSIIQPDLYIPILLDSLVSYLCDYNIDNVINFTTKKNNKSLALTGLDITYYILYLIGTITDKDLSTVTTWQIRHLYDPYKIYDTASIDSIDAYGRDLFDRFTEDALTLYTIDTPDDIRSYAAVQTAIADLYILTRNNFHNSAFSSQFSVYFEKHLENRSITIPSKPNLSDYVETHINEVAKEEALEELNHIVHEFTGISIVSTYDILKDLDNMREVLTRILSYTTSIITDISKVDGNVDRTSINGIHSLNASTITDGEFDLLGAIALNLTYYGNDSRPNIKTIGSPAVKIENDHNRTSLVKVREINGILAIPDQIRIVSL